MNRDRRELADNGNAVCSCTSVRCAALDVQM